MDNDFKIDVHQQKLIVYLALVFITFAVYGQVPQFDFINVDDDFFITNNSHIRLGMTLEGIQWAFGSTYGQFWFPLTWLSWMLDYQIYGLNAGGYHLTNVILHALCSILLFALFHRMTGAVWRSAFVAAFFAFHPLRVESVAYISERSDVLSAFFGILTLYLYVYYTEKPALIRYLSVLICFIFGLMSKPIVLTLPLLMILIDYWPLGRFQARRGNPVLWQLREKGLFFICSTIFSMMTLYTQYKPFASSMKQLQQYFPPLNLRIANALVSFAGYLEKTFWPNNLAAFLALPDQPPFWQLVASTLIILILSVAVMAAVRSLPYFFVGWLWYAITVLPVIGIIPIVNVSARSMADRYTYLPSIGIAVALAWGIPSLMGSRKMRGNILFPASILMLLMLALFTWQQSGYWRNSMELVNRTLRVTKDNYTAYFIRAKAYYELGHYQRAVDDCSKALHLKPDFAAVYFSRGAAYDQLGEYHLAVMDYSQTIRLQPDYIEAYKRRAIDYSKNLGQYQKAIDDLNVIIKLEPTYARAYHNRGGVFFLLGNKPLGCFDAQKACSLGDCELLEMSKRGGLCP